MRFSTTVDSSPEELTPEVVIEFPSIELAQRFMLWFDNQGEQDYFEYLAGDVGCTRFDYDYQARRIVGRK